MKPILIGLLAITTTIYSCTEEEDIDRFTENLIGQYMCNSALWMCDNDIDINGDTVAGKDLFVEFYGIDRAYGALINSVIRIFPVNTFKELSDCSFIEFPLQGLQKTMDGNSYVFGTNARYGLFSFSYSVDQGGLIKISCPQVLPIDGKTEFMPSNEDIIIDELGNNYLRFTINSRFYDFKTNAVVVGPVRYSYRRVFNDPYESNINTYVPYYN